MTKQRSGPSLRLLYPVVGAAMLILFALGHYVILEYRKQQLDSVAEAASHYIRAVMKPLAREMDGNDMSGSAFAGKYPTTFADEEIRAEFLLEKIWNRDGALVFTSEPGAPRESHRNDALYRALDGKIAVELHDSAEDADELKPDGRAMVLPYIEVYVPLVDNATGELIAVGEVYQEAADLLALRARFERSIWSAVMLAVAGLLGLIGVSAALSRRLSSELVRVQALAEQNQTLRDRAERARLDGASANEALLNRLGAEIHDGPVQVLTLMLLKGTQPEEDAAMTREAVNELRAMSSGLILPELRGLSAADTIRLAVERHETLTRSDVSVELGPLPDQVSDEIRVCLYRVVQEGLSNAFRHAGGRGQSVVARSETGQLHVKILDSGPEVAASQRERFASPLGLLGMRHRLSPLGGRAQFSRPGGKGGELHIQIPIDPTSTN